MPLTNLGTLLLGSRLDPSLNIGFPKPRGLLYLSSEKCLCLARKWCLIRATNFFHVLDPNDNVDSLGPNFCSQPIELLNFVIFVVLDYSVKPIMSLRSFNGIHVNVLKVAFSLKMWIKTLMSSRHFHHMRFMVNCSLH